MPLYFSHSKKVALALIPKISGSFSFIASSWIMIEVLTSINKRSTVYNRLLLLMSTMDAIVSVSYIASTWPIPSITPTGEGGFFYILPDVDTTCDIDATDNFPSFSSSNQWYGLLGRFRRVLGRDT
jgi:hypothetical protein